MRCLPQPVSSLCRLEASPISGGLRDKDITEEEKDSLKCSLIWGGKKISNMYTSISIYLYASKNSDSSYFYQALQKDAIAFKHLKARKYTKEISHR